jgi:ABC-type dipeptide/oligopeptide/nickel transport system permease component
MPGDPATAVLGDYASKEAVNALREQMGLNRPIMVQYFSYLIDIVRLDFGKSLIHNIPVSDRIFSVLPYSLMLTFSGIFIGYLFGIPLGIYAAIHRNSFIDYFNRVFSLIGLSVPAFFLGIILILIFSIQFNFFPIVGGGDFSNILNVLHHLFLPALTLGLIMTAYVTRLTRSSFLEILREDYVRTAESKGLNNRTVMYKHALRNALIPIVSLGGLYAVGLIGSSVMVEIVFSRPGLGTLLVAATKQRDYTTLQSLMVFFTIIVVILNLFTDLVYSLIDPRIKHN